jgi:hypothetical protein
MAGPGWSPFQQTQVELSRGPLWEECVSLGPPMADMGDKRAMMIADAVCGGKGRGAAKWAKSKR